MDVQAALTRMDEIDHLMFTDDKDDLAEYHKVAPSLGSLINEMMALRAAIVQAVGKVAVWTEQGYELREIVPCSRSDSPWGRGRGRGTTYTT